MTIEEKLLFVSNVAANIGRLLATQDPLAKQLGGELLADLRAYRATHRLDELDSGREIIRLMAEARRELGKERMRIEGPKLWAELHRQSLVGLVDARWLREWSQRIPCGECRSEFNRILTELPLPFMRDDAFSWSVAVHNRVNAKLELPAMSESDAREKWAA